MLLFYYRFLSNQTFECEVVSLGCNVIRNCYPSCTIFYVFFNNNLKLLIKHPRVLHTGCSHMRITKDCGFSRAAFLHLQPVCIRHDIFLNIMWSIMRRVAYFRMYPETRFQLRLEFAVSRNVCYKSNFMVGWRILPGDSSRVLWGHVSSRYNRHHCKTEEKEPRLIRSCPRCEITSSTRKPQ